MVKMVTAAWVVKNHIELRGMTQGQAAETLGVSRITLSRFLNGHSDLSVEMAVRLTRYFGLDGFFLLQRQLGINFIKAQKALDEL